MNRIGVTIDPSMSGVTVVYRKHQQQAVWLAYRLYGGLGDATIIAQVPRIEALLNEYENAR